MTPIVAVLLLLALLCAIAALRAHLNQPLPQPKETTVKTPVKKTAPKKQTSPALSRLAARVMAGHLPTPAEAKRLAASVLSQDETPAPKKRAAKKKAA